MRILKYIIMFLIGYTLMGWYDHNIQAAPEKCPQLNVHPIMTAANNDESTSEFMNGISAKCPAGMKVYDPAHTIHDKMTVQDIFNAISHVECR